MEVRPCMWTSRYSRRTRSARARCAEDQEASAMQSPHPTGTPGAAGPVKSAARALDILDEIAASGPGTQLQLSTRLGIPKSSLHALLRTMTDRGWLETDQTGSVYQLGIHSLVVSSAYLAGDPVLARAAAIMDEIAGATGGDRQPGPARRQPGHLHGQARVRAPPAHALPRRPAPPRLLHRARAGDPGRATRRRPGRRSSPHSIAPITAQTVTDRDAVLGSSTTPRGSATRPRARSPASGCAASGSRCRSPAPRSTV